MKKLSPDDPLMKHLEGFDTSTKPGGLAAIEWLKSRGVEEAFWDDDKIETAADWYIGEARIDGMIKVLENRIHRFFPEKP